MAGSVVIKMERLKLALAWNRTDFAKEILMSDGASWPVCFSVDFFYMCSLFSV